MEIVNDLYWLEYAKTSISNSLSSRNTAAAKLEKMTLWFWGIYTASFTIGVTINLIDAPLYVLFLLGSPIATLIITYWFCVEAQMPIQVKFDSRIPYEIKKAYNLGVEIKRKKFQIAKSLSFVSAILLAAALSVLSYTDKKEEANMDVFIDKGTNTLVVSGAFPKGTKITTEIDSLDCNVNKICFYRNVHLIQQNESLNLNLELKKIPKEVIVYTTWENKRKKEGFVMSVGEN